MKPRARDLGVPFDGTPGKYNAITDVPGVTVGHSTFISGEGELVVGEGPIRTGVTAVHPRGDNHDPVFAAWYSINGCGEMTGTTWVEESGMLNGPVMLTNTLSIGTAYRVTIEWMIQRTKSTFGLPVVTETYDGYLNDIHGFHVKPEHVVEALESAHGSFLEEGNVGGGTGMCCYDFKGGIGTASRVIQNGNHEFHLGVLVQANHGSRKNLTIAGMPVGQEINDLMPGIVNHEGNFKTSSIIVLVATDLPLLPHQLKRIARRVPMGMARTGAISEYTSGDIFLAFSTAHIEQVDEHGFRSIQTYDDWRLNPYFEATIQATEESIINALIAAETMAGINNYTVHALPHDRLQALLVRHNRIAIDTGS